MRSSSLYAMFALTGMVFGAEAVSNHVTQSSVLLVSALHMLYNFFSLLLVVISHRMSRGKTLINTFGWAQDKVANLLMKMLFLCILCFVISAKAVRTMVYASHENTEPRYPRLIITLGGIDFALNIICFLLIGGYTHQGCSMITQLNCVLTDPDVGGDSKCKETEEALTHGTSNNLKKKTCRCWDHQLLDVSRDVSSCIMVICYGCAILCMDGLILKYADAILTLASAIILFSSTCPFVKESGLVLLQGIPDHIDVKGLTKKLELEERGICIVKGSLTSQSLVGVYAGHSTKVELVNGDLTWPVTLFYPQYGISDFIPNFNENSSFCDYFCEMFRVPQEWDLKEEYVPDKLKVYFWDERESVFPVAISNSLKSVMQHKSFKVVGANLKFFVTCPEYDEIYRTQNYIMMIKKHLGL